MYIKLRSKILKLKSLIFSSQLIILIIKMNEVKKEIHSITNLAATTALNAKINEVKNRLANITNLATATTALTAG